MSFRQFDLTPDPNVLIALTQTPLRQMDALCELIDNAIDSFSSAQRQGIVIDNPCVQIFIPKDSEVKKGLGCVRIIDNGPGLTLETAEKALRAGYSSNNQYDNLGLFGMGFNISTGKMGSVTTLTTMRSESDVGLQVVIDLNEMNKKKSYQVTPKEVEKPFDHGSEVEIHGWWPEGNSNNGFIRTLARYSVSKITEELGRRYASLLRSNKVTIMVNGVKCEPYEFCVWGANRHVIRKKYGEIPAVYNLDRVIFTQRKCFKCGTLLENFQNECPACGCTEIRTVEERIKGWVGIQRYDSSTDFGIDLIRNGRAIRIAEKAAFFEYTDEFNKTVMDYPIDGPFGRIVGEIHLDHVPVDFLKRDFQRSTPEWQRAMSYIRGDSSLQPTQKGAENNQSPVFKLYQGYRSVRTAGTKDLYMGYWDVTKNSPHRISREVEEEFIKRFKNKEPGFYDDAKWWEKVEEADRPPVPELPTCPECGAQILDTDEVCSLCGFILRGKNCIKCSETIPASAKVCPKCGASQEAEIMKPWKCDVCGKVNAATANVCINCGQEKGTKNTLAIEYLKEHSNKDDGLSIDNCSVSLPDGSVSSALRVNVYVTTSHITPNLTKEDLPIYVIKNEIGSVDIFIDKTHKVFTSYGITPEFLVASEIADRIKLLSGSGHDIEGVSSVSTIAWQILGKYWKTTLEMSSDNTKNEISALFNNIKERLAMTIGSEAEDYYGEMTEAQSTDMAKAIIGAGYDISKIGEMKQNGEYLRFVRDDFVIRLYELNPMLFFDGRVWDEKFETLSAPAEIKVISQQQIKNNYLVCLNDIANYLKLNLSDPLFIQKTMCAVEYLKKRVVMDVY